MNAIQNAKLHCIIRSTDISNLDEIALPKPSKILLKQLETLGDMFQRPVFYKETEYSTSYKFLSGKSALAAALEFSKGKRNNNLSCIVLVGPEQLSLAPDLDNYR